MIQILLTTLVLALSARGTVAGELAWVAYVPAYLRLRDTPNLGLLLSVPLTYSGLFLATFEGALPDVPGFFLFGLLLSSFWYLCVGLCLILLRRRLNASSAPWAIPILFTTFEQIAGAHFLWGERSLPTSLAYTQVDTALGQAARLGGYATVTFLVLAINISVAELLLSPSRWRRGFALTILSLVTLVVATLDKLTPRQTSYTDIDVAIIQPNIPSRVHSFQHADPSPSESIVESLLSVQPIDTTLSSLFVWPEGVLSLSDFVSPSMGSHADKNVISGAIIRKNGELLNAVVQVARGFDVLYAKRALMPIAEAEYSAGKVTTTLFSTSEWYSLLICLESVYAEIVRDTLALQPDALIVIGDSSFAGSMQTGVLHLRATTMRAIEVGIPVIFGTATGPSAVILPDGRLVHTLPRNLSAQAHVKISTPSLYTLASLHGNWSGLFMVGATLLVLVQSTCLTHSRV